jgi:hypothetical protein
MKIGIFALDLNLGVSGGLAVHTNQLINALANYDHDNNYVLIVLQNGGKILKNRKFPENFQIFPINYKTYMEGANNRIAEYLNLFSLPIRLIWLEAGIAKQLDNLDLDLIHYPSTIIYPLRVKSKCVLTFFDLQHIYYPQFFSLAER